jgi:hypothetical protein
MRQHEREQAARGLEPDEKDPGKYRDRTAGSGRVLRVVDDGVE